MPQNSHNKIAIHMPDWVDIRTLCEEYKIDINQLAEAIEERKIQTRGRLFDDRSECIESYTGRADGFVGIPEEKWSEYLFESNSFELKPSAEHPTGEKVTLTFLVRYEYETFLGVPDAMPVRLGYTDIKINRADFERKIKIKTVPTGKRTHKQIKYIKEIYDRFNRLHNTEKAKPEEVLAYAIEHYCEDGLKANDFEITDTEIHPTDTRKSKLFYVVEDKEDNQMTYGRFYNIISEFNHAKKK